MKDTQAVNNTFFYFFADEVFNSSKPIAVNDFFDLSEVDFLIELNKYYQVVFDSIINNDRSAIYSLADLKPFFNLAANVFVEFLELQAKQTSKLEFSFPDLEIFKSSLVGTFESLI